MRNEINVTHFVKVVEDRKEAIRQFAVLRRLCSGIVKQAITKASTGRRNYISNAIVHYNISDVIPIVTASIDTGTVRRNNQLHRDVLNTLKTLEKLYKDADLLDSTSDTWGPEWRKSLRKTKPHNTECKKLKIKLAKRKAFLAKWNEQYKGK